MDGTRSLLDFFAMIPSNENQSLVLRLLGWSVCLAAGLLLTIAVIVVGVFVPVSERIAEIALFPGAWIAEKMPGGIGHNPFNLLLAVILQTVTYAILIHLVLQLVNRYWRSSNKG